MNHEKFQKCIDACYKCAIACDHCAAECLKENEVRMLTQCIQLNIECSSFCREAAHMMSIGGTLAKQLCDLCAKICEHCGNECEIHSSMEHCRACAAECRKCAAKCREMAMEKVV
jgi:hypothetical protein